MLVQGIEAISVDEIGGYLAGFAVANDYLRGGKTEHTDQIYHTLVLRSGSNCRQSQAVGANRG